MNKNDIDIAALVDAVENASMRVEYFKHFGRRGDGRDIAANKALNDARRAILSAMREARIAAMCEAAN